MSPKMAFRRSSYALWTRISACAIRLRIVSGGTELINQPLLDDASGRTGQVVAHYVFEPSKLGLAAGDEAVFWGVAEDNRTAPGSTEPAPNVQRTRNYHFRIVAARQPDGSPAPSPDEPAPKKESPSSGDSAGDAQSGGEGGQAGSAGSGQSTSAEGEKNGTEKGTPSGAGEAGSKQDTPMEQGGQSEGGVSEPNGSQDPSNTEGQTSPGDGQAGGGAGSQTAASDGAGGRTSGGTAGRRGRWRAIA